MLQSTSKNPLAALLKPKYTSIFSLGLLDDRNLGSWFVGEQSSIPG